MNYSGTEMNITACVVSADIAVAPEGVVEMLRCLRMSAGFCQGSETLAGDGRPSCLSSSSGTVHQGMNVTLVLIYLFCVFTQKRRGLCWGLYWLVLLVCWESEFCVSLGWQKLILLSKAFMKGERYLMHLCSAWLLVSSHGQLGMGAYSWLSGAGAVQLSTTLDQWCWCLALSIAWIMNLS